MIASAGHKLSALIAHVGALSRRRKTALAAVAMAASVSAPALALTLATTPWSDGPPPLVEFFDRDKPQTPAAETPVLTWVGRDIDGDGAADIVNPTGQAPRTEDAYGEGAFGASRDGGSRDHEGVDYVADAGQAVVAPISGFIGKIGYAYAGDRELKFVEIDNPALKLTARVFYVDATVEVGQAVRLGAPIGTAHTLQKKYPGGMTDHVHLEVANAKGRRLDAATLIQARYS